MQLEIIFKIVTAIVGIVITAGVKLYDINIGKQSRFREDYKFSKDFFEERQKNPDLHPFVVEKGYQAIAGSRRVDPEEIAYILSLKNPSQCLYDYQKGKKYLSKLDIYGDFKLSFKRKYSKPWSRKWRKGLYLIFYFISSFLALTPIFLNPSFYLIIISFVLYIPSALWFLEKVGEIYSAERLVKNQQKYRTNIHLPSNNFYTRK